MSVEIKSRPDETDILVANRLRTRRLVLGLSQRDLGTAINVTVQQIQKYEKGLNRISSGKLWGIARSLKVPVHYFFEEKSDVTNIINNAALSPENEREVIALLKSFRNISNGKVRKKVVELIDAVAYQEEYC